MAIDGSYLAECDVLSYSIQSILLLALLEIVFGLLHCLEIHTVMGDSIYIQLLILLL